MFPTIHLNGTSPGELITAIEDATHAINLACDAIAKTAPNKRDYPDFISRVQREERFVSARDAVQADLTALHNILHRLQAVWENINDQTATQRANAASAAYNDRVKK